MLRFRPQLSSSPPSLRFDRSAARWLDLPPLPCFARINTWLVISSGRQPTGDDGTCMSSGWPLSLLEFARMPARALDSARVTFLDVNLGVLLGWYGCKLMPQSPGTRSPSHLPARARASRRLVDDVFGYGMWSLASLGVHGAFCLPAQLPFSVPRLQHHIPWRGGSP